MTLGGDEPPLQLLVPKKTKKKQSTACSKKKKSCIAVWCVVNKVILQNSFGSSETSRRHLAELKANIDVVLGKWGSLHRLFSPPLCLEFFFFFRDSHHLVDVPTPFIYLFFSFCVFSSTAPLPGLAGDAGQIVAG